MPVYKMTYDVTLKPAPGGFCTSPLEILRQMHTAQAQAEKNLRGFLSETALLADVRTIRPIDGQIGIVIDCSENVASRIAAQPFAKKLEPYTPPPARKTPPFPKFGF